MNDTTTAASPTLAKMLGDLHDMGKDDAVLDGDRITVPLDTSYNPYLRFGVDDDSDEYKFVLTSPQEDIITLAAMNASETETFPDAAMTNTVEKVGILLAYGFMNLEAMVASANDDPDAGTMRLLTAITGISLGIVTAEGHLPGCDGQHD